MFKVGNFIERVKIDKSTVKKKQMEEKSIFLAEMLARKKSFHRKIIATKFMFLEIPCINLNGNLQKI